MQIIELLTESRRCIAEDDFLGYEGENNANKLVFKFTDGFIDGLAELIVIRDDQKGVIELSKVDETYEFPVKSSILSKEGKLKFQLVITTSSGDCYKFNPFTMIVKDALDSDIPMPEEYPNWIDLANSKLAELEEAIINSEKVIGDIVIAKENGEFNGKDGFSPSAMVEQTDDGAVITITDEKGTTTAKIKHGQGGNQSGEAGADGFSPIANVVETENGATITITDKKGTTTATIYNGKDGKNGDAGKPGADGLTPHIGDNGNWWIGDTDLGVSAGGSGGSTTLPDRAYFNYHKGEAPVTNKFLSLTNTSLRGIELDSDGNPILKAGKTYKITLSLYGCNIQNKSTNRFVLSKTKSDGTKNNVSFIYPPSAASAGGQGQNLPSYVGIEIPIKDFSLQIWAIHATLADFVTTGCTSLAFDLMVDEII